MSFVFNDTGAVYHAAETEQALTLAPFDPTQGSSDVSHFGIGVGIDYAEYDTLGLPGDCTPVTISKSGQVSVGDQTEAVQLPMKVAEAPAGNAMQQALLTAFAQAGEPAPATPKAISKKKGKQVLPAGPRPQQPAARQQAEPNLLDDDILADLTTVTVEAGLVPQLTDGVDYVNYNNHDGLTMLGQEFDPWVGRGYNINVARLGHFQCLAGIFYYIKDRNAEPEVRALWKTLEGAAARRLLADRRDYLEKVPGALACMAAAIEIKLRSHPEMKEDFLKLGNLPCEAFYYTESSSRPVHVIEGEHYTTIMYELWDRISNNMGGTYSDALKIAV